MIFVTRIKYGCIPLEMSAPALALKGVSSTVKEYRQAIPYMKLIISNHSIFK